MKLPESSRRPGLELIDVPMGGWARGNSGQVLQTSGLSLSVGIAAYNPDLRVGHLGHFFCPSELDTSLFNFLQDIRAGTEDLSNIQTWVRGGEPGPSCDEEMVRFGRQTRDFTQFAIAAAGFEPAKTDIEWSVYGEIVGMTLDCADGQLNTTSINVAQLY